MAQLNGKKAIQGDLCGTGFRSQMEINPEEYFGNGINHTPWARNWTMPAPDDFRRERDYVSIPLIFILIAADYRLLISPRGFFRHSSGNCRRCQKELNDW
ncbi:MAG TPA: hypothetical protein PKZ26_09750 [Anaerolineaceae bacterium]|nr:hypothetical protein [Anaerolineaceae bacterium]